MNWKKESNGTTALLIEGARRVGKSTIVTEFAKNEYQSFILVDFDKEGDDLKEIFSHGFGNLDSFFMSLSAYYNVPLYKRKSLIIFDEIQKFPRAHEGIKYLVQDGRYDFIETGSLITLKLLTKEITLPSEVENIYMYPMDFEEFLWALNDNITIPTIKQHFDSKIPLGNGLHHKILIQYRTYMAVGGLPQAIDQYIKDKTNLLKVDAIKRRILDLYTSDLKKYDLECKTITSEVFSKIPSFLTNKNGLVTFADFNKNYRYQNLVSTIDGIKKSMVAIICENVSEPSIGLSLNALPNEMKIYQADTGLLITQILSNNKEANKDIYKKVIIDRLSLNNGMIFENAVAQALVASGHNLYFHKFKENKGDCTNNYEIDFLIERKGKIVPIEVKSSSYRNHRSLDKFIEKYKGSLDKFIEKYKDIKTNESYIIYAKDLYVEGKVTYIPIYMTMFL